MNSTGKGRTAREGRVLQQRRMGIGLIMPIKPDIIREVQSSSLADAALWGGVLSTVFAVMPFLFGPIIGNLSDSFGRRPMMLISLDLIAADYLVMALAGSIWLLLLGRIVGGISAAASPGSGPTRSAPFAKSPACPRSARCWRSMSSVPWRSMSAPRSGRISRKSALAEHRRRSACRWAYSG